MAAPRWRLSIISSIQMTIYRKCIQLVFAQLSSTGCAAAAEVKQIIVLPDRVAKA
jgi:hypothetical protein